MGLSKIITNVNFKLSDEERKQLHIQNLQIKCDKLILTNTAKMEEAMRQVERYRNTLGLLEKVSETLECLSKIKDE
jgi:hypothetical protein